MDHNIEKVDVFNYQDYRSYLKSFYLQRRKKDRKFSIRYFARRAGLKSQNYLKVVMDGRRNLTSRNLPKFIKGLGLDTVQAAYFEALVNLNQARDPAEKKEFYQKVLHLQKRKAAHTLKENQLEFFSHWYNLAIFEMVCQEGFDADPLQLSRRLRGKVSPEEVRASLALMDRIGLLIKNQDGTLTPLANEVLPPPQIDSKLFFPLYDVFMAQASLALNEDPINDRDVKGLTIGLTKEQVPLFIEKIKEFGRELSIFFSTGKGTDIYQFNTQFFKLTKSDIEG